jgi:hypothetical protein
MKWKRIGNRLIPSFLKRKKEGELADKRLGHLLYEFSVNAENTSLDIEFIKKTILMNPWCMLSKPDVIFRENSEENSVRISFHVLSDAKGKEIEMLIRDTLFGAA